MIVAVERRVLNLRFQRTKAFPAFLLDDSATVRCSCSCSS